MNNFTHISLPNPGVTTGNLPEELYKQVIEEVNEISFDFHSHSNYNNGLAGISTSPTVQRLLPLKYRDYSS